MSIKTSNRLFSIFGKNKNVSNAHFHEDEYYYKEITSIVGAGSWYIDFVEKKSYFDKQLRKLLETPPGYRPSLKHSLHFYDMEFHEAIQKDFERVLKGLPFENEVKAVTYTNKTFWGHIMGKPAKNDFGKVIGFRGILLNIDDKKKKEIALNESLEVIEKNNDRLFKFANYVSHNLKSHVNNLELTSQLVDQDTLESDQKELFDNYNAIAKSLARTVSQLNDVVSIQNKIQEKKTVLNLNEILENCKIDLNKLIEKEEAYIYSDFSEVPEILYIKDFLENIIKTLISFGIQNKKAGRKPEIKAYSLEDKGKQSLILEDNGAGIDLEKDGERIFRMSRANDSQPENQSADLFIVKNQVEALGGKIEIMSKVGYGTKFIISL